LIKNSSSLTRAARVRQADEYAGRIYKVIHAFRDEGMSLNAIARRLTADGELTPRGKAGWTATAVRNVIKRVEGSSLFL
jgi:hypothetical protein